MTPFLSSFVAFIAGLVRSGERDACHLRQPERIRPLEPRPGSDAPPSERTTTPKFM